RIRTCRVRRDVCVIEQADRASMYTHVAASAGCDRHDHRRKVDRERRLNRTEKSGGVRHDFLGHVRRHNGGPGKVKRPALKDRYVGRDAGIEICKEENPKTIGDVAAKRTEGREGVKGTS